MSKFAKSCDSGVKTNWKTQKNGKFTPFYPIFHSNFIQSLLNEKTLSGYKRNQDKGSQIYSKIKNAVNAVNKIQNTVNAVITACCKNVFHFHRYSIHFWLFHPSFGCNEFYIWLLLKLRSSICFELKSIE